MAAASFLVERTEAFGKEQPAVLHALGTRLVQAAERIEHDAS